MNWQAAKDRARVATARAREWGAKHLTRRRVVGAILLCSMVLGIAIGVEAVLRARIPELGARAPSALYTRPAGWNGSDQTPIPIGTLSGAAMEYRVPVRLRDLPEHLVNAVLAVEDQRFHDHWGLDPRRIAGAAVANLRARGISQGGSTITQQLAKNLYLTADRTPLRKLREAAMAVVLEARHTKEEILEAYLNEIYLGQDRGAAIHGVGAASRYYFGKDVQRIVTSEAATLAAMIPAPNRLSPQRRPAELRARRNLVLDLMTEQGRLPARVRDQASRVAVPTRAYPRRTVEGRWFRDHAIESAPKGLPRRGVAVYTTLDAGLQRAAEEAVARGLALTGHPATQAALVAMDPRSGEILAMVGGRAYGASQFNRAVQARRQPGSAFKPIVALAALERQRNREPAYTLASTLADEPLSVRSGPDLWQPANYDGEFRGEVTLREALEQSLNVPFARIGLELGPARIVETAQRLGIRSPLQRVPALALGASEVSLLELVRAYGVFAAAGELAATRPILGVARGGGEVEWRDPPERQRVADPAAAWLVTSALEGVVDHGTGRALRRGGFAGKTGTSNAFRDAWFVAYTPELVVGVWVGHDDGESLRRTGGAVAVPIVARFLDQGRVRGGNFPMPEGIEQGRIGGGGWFDSCGTAEYFLAGTAPADGGCWSIDLADIGRWFRGGDFDDDEDHDEDDEDRDRDGRRQRLERERERDALRAAQRRIRDQAEEEFERLRREVERQLRRNRLR